MERALARIAADRLDEPLLIRTMPLLTVKQAARRFGVHISTVRRVTRDGTARVTGGCRGRGHATLLDEAMLAELLTAVPQRKRRSPEVSEQLERGARAATLPDAITDELKWALNRGDLYRWNIPLHLHEQILKYIGLRMCERISEHLKLKLSK